MHADTAGDVAAPSHTPTVASILRHRGFRDLVVGQSVSAFGDWMVTVAFMALVLDLTGSSTAVGGILVLRLLPTVVAGPIATRAVRRWDVRRTMLAADLGRAVVVALVPWVRAAWWVYTCAFVLELGSLVFLPARDSSVPALVPRDALESANGLLLATSYGLIPIGAGAFALLSAILPGARSGRLSLIVVFGLDAATFVWSYLMIRRIPELVACQRAETDERGRPPPARFRDAFRIAIVRELLWPALLASLGIGCLFSVGIVFVRKVLDASNAQFSILVVLFGVGATVGLAVLRATNAHGVHVTRATLAGQGAVMGAMSLAPSVPIAFVAAVAFGGLTAVTLTTSMSALQTNVREQNRAAAFTVFHVVIRAGLALAAVGAGIAADVLRGVRWPLVGRLEPARVVLLVSGATVVISTALVHLQGTRRARSRREEHAREP